MSNGDGELEVMPETDLWLLMSDAYWHFFQIQSLSVSGIFGMSGIFLVLFKCMMAFEFELIFVFAWMVDSKGLTNMNDICMNV